jgi:hypothetical protein
MQSSPIYNNFPQNKIPHWYQREWHDQQPSQM